MTDNNSEEATVVSPRGHKRRAQLSSPDIQPAQKAQRIENQTSFANGSPTEPAHQSPNNQLFDVQPFRIQPFEAHQLTETQRHAAEADQIAREIRYLFQEEPDVADYVLGVANISQSPTSSNNLPSGSGPPVYPAPFNCQSTLTSLITNPGGLPYDNPYPKAEHDYEAEAKMYEAQEKEHQKMREAEFAKNPPTFPYPRNGSQPPSSSGYGGEMGNGGLGTSRYLGVNWESAEKGGRNAEQDGDEE